MTNTFTLDDANQLLGIHDQAAGITQAITAPSIQAWRIAARDAILSLANTGRPFTADDLIDIVGLPHDLEVNKNNSVGAVILNALRSGQIVNTGERKPSARRSNHGRHIPIWIGTRHG